MNRFSQPPKSWNEVLGFFQETPWGRATFHEFSKLYRTEKVAIDYFPTEVLTRLREEYSEKTPLGAIFVTDGQKGTIYLDPRSPLGILVPFLFHEMIHCLDQSLWNAAQQKMQRGVRRDLIFNAECRAFSAQHRFQEELKALHPELRTFHEKKYPEISFLNRELEPAEIATLYRGTLV